MSSELDFGPVEANAAAASLHSEYIDRPVAALLASDSATSMTDILPSLELVTSKTDAKIEQLPYREGIDDQPQSPQQEDPEANPDSQEQGTARQVLDELPYDAAADALTTGEFGDLQEMVIERMVGDGLNAAGPAGVEAMLDKLNQRLQQRGYSLDFDEQASQDARQGLLPNVMPLRLTLRNGDRALGTAGIDLQVWEGPGYDI
jgi:hypothetical protein